MTHKHKEIQHAVKPGTGLAKSLSGVKRPQLEIVLKADSAGSLEAIVKGISEITLSESDVSIIHSGVGDVSKSDILMAETGSRLIVGFQVNVLAGMEALLREQRVEVRLYEVIYTATSDIRTIAESLVPPVSGDEIIGSAKVIALFKSSRRGIIIGCEILGGHLAIGQRFRVISAMGPVYSGSVESMHIGEKAVQKATPGQRVGIKIKDFREAKIGDIVESYRISRKAPAWEPNGEVIRR